MELKKDYEIYEYADSTFGIARKGTEGAEILWGGDHTNPDNKDRKLVDEMFDYIFGHYTITRKSGTGELVTTYSRRVVNGQIIEVEREEEYDYDDCDEEEEDEDL